ncbi:glutathione-dependent formaldehyde-activating enzyme family [Lecanosticta acicola]|uniref:Glutathione-dependent formaldehyde-activating enzyme family n=1 Tax=Lecanosticta acicola TaxID=111012 RepID=A0AAI8YT84_9PEZI|nr:glutathione-dependent formaldehyde-activating enzyme family [Lecanosticta acicola]
MAAKAQAAPISRTSSCLCGAVSITFEGFDKGAVLCHCSNCKSASGSAFMHNHRLLKADIHITQGLHCLREYADSATTSGNTLYRHFCSNCGSQLYLTNSKIAGFVAINAGNMQGERAGPFMELFLDNKYPWIGDVTGKEVKAKL